MASNIALAPKVCDQDDAGCHCTWHEVGDLLRWLTDWNLTVHARRGDSSLIEEPVGQYICSLLGRGRICLLDAAGRGRGIGRCRLGRYIRRRNAYHSIQYNSQPVDTMSVSLNSV